MTTKELIQAEIEKVDDEHLGELYRLIRDFTQHTEQAKPTLMSRLKQVQIEGPEDFAANLDLYVSGGK